MILDDKKYIAKKIKEYRLKMGLTQAELAEKIDIGTKQISRIEVADFYPSLNTFLKIVEVLKIDLNNFIAEDLKDENRTRKKLIKLIYNANNEELEFFDRLITFATDEANEVKKNMMIKRVR